MTFTDHYFNKNSALRKAAVDYRDRKNISVFGVERFAKIAICAEADKAIVLCSDVSGARETASELCAFGKRAIMLAEKEDELSFVANKSGENIIDRLNAFYLALTDKVDFVVITPRSLLNLYPDREQFLSSIISLKKGNEVEPQQVVKRLIGSGYGRVSQVSDIGEFALRGDILDIYPTNGKCAVRIEFFGDEIEKIRLIDAESQLSTKECDEIDIAPFAEIFEFDKGVTEELKRGWSKELSPDGRAKAEEIEDALISSVESGEIRYCQNWLLPSCKHSDIFGFFGIDRLVIDEAKQCYDALENCKKEHFSRWEELYKRGEVTSLQKRQLLEPDYVSRKELSMLAFHRITSANRFFNPKAVYKIECKPVPSYLRDFRPMLTDIEKWKKRGYQITFFATGATFGIIRGFLSDNGLLGGNISLVDAPYGKGCILEEDGRVFICNNDLSYKTPKKHIARSKRNLFTAPEVGDFVVHDVHGIGKCEGVVKMQVMGAEREYLIVLYAGGDKLYVPIENMDSLSRYVAGSSPKLSKMGGVEFKKLKDKVKASVKKLAVDLMSLYSERMELKGHKYSQDDGLLKEFENRFPFEETADQISAVEECLKDLKSGKIMDRLLCGDVGYGKTEVALRVAFKVICEGKQVAFMSPTTILAKQHFQTVQKRMEEFGVNAVRLTRLDSVKSVNEATVALKEGKADIAVGTHKLLSKNIEFKDLGLLILDEEQRFGVSDKEKIKDIKRNVNVLTLTATPIPRTLHMSMVGIRDISVLDEPPTNRIPVQTFVTEYTDGLLQDAVMREVGRSGQVFIVYNKVASIDQFAARLGEMMPSVRFCVAHGQMEERALERRIDDFVEGKYDVLVASTIIENGIDMPRANTLFVVDADRMGLSQLYQLKGRVGRSDRMAYAYFTYDERKAMTETAQKRLDALASYTEFGSGFKLAMRDMEIRGAGNIMGAEQHGHMEKVGYDTYCALMRESLAELEGKPIEKKREVRMTVDYDTYIPDSYVGAGEWRLKLYSRIAEVATPQERERLLGEMLEVYGQIPPSVKNLVNVALMKNLASKINAVAVVIKKTERKVVFERVADLRNDVNSLATEFSAKLVLDEKPYLKFRTNDDMVKFLLKCHKIVG